MQMAVNQQTDPIAFRAATLSDVDALLAIENSCFDSDQLSRRSFKWMINKANALLLVAEQQQKLMGYVLLLYARGTSLGRIYSLAVLPKYRNQKIARALMREAEQAALTAGRSFIRLEVRRCCNHNRKNCISRYFIIPKAPILPVARPA
jgi:ribosomal protein S18 acetylase RimI-like enzyme